MPNTLAHVAIQTAVFAASPRRVPLLVVLFGCIIPDVPWILRRAIEATAVSVDLDLLYAYTIAQASLLFCAVFAMALAVLFRAAVAAWLAIGIGCLLHLLLDALQDKWGNGVHLLAPFDWSMFSIGVWEMESTVLQVASALGILPFLLYRPAFDAQAIRLSPGRIYLAGSILLVYLSAPAAFTDAVFESNSYHLGTLHVPEARTGRWVEFDRKRVIPDAEAVVLVTHAGERLRLVGELLPKVSGTYSVRGTFLSEDVVRIAAWKSHSRTRDIASIVGIALAAFWSMLVLFRVRGRRMTSTADAEGSTRSRD